MTCAREPELGVYVLGALDRTERSGLETHLTGCPACRAELDRLAPLPGLLARLDAADAARLVDDDGGQPLQVAAPPGALLDRVVAAAARGRRRSQLARAAVLAASLLVLALAGGAIVALLGPGDDPRAPGPLTSAATDPRTGVRAEVVLHRRPWGTRVDLRLTGVPPGQRCKLVARTVGGRSEVAASWRASYRGAASVPGAIGVAPERLRALDVVAASDRTLVSLPAPPVEPSGADIRRRW